MRGLILILVVAVAVPTTAGLDPAPTTQPDDNTRLLEQVKQALDSSEEVLRRPRATRDDLALLQRELEDQSAEIRIIQDDFLNGIIDSINYAYWTDRNTSAIEAARETERNDDNWWDPIVRPIRATVRAVKHLPSIAETAVKNLLKVPTALLTGDFRRLAHMNPLNVLTLNVIPTAVEAAGSLASDGLSIVGVQGLLAPAFEERPDTVSTDRCPVYYVNGINCSRRSADRQAEALSQQLKRQVVLIYNPNHGQVGNLANAALGRLSPAPIMSSYDPTTRKLLWVLDHCHTRVTVITFSGGCIWMRNAVIAATFFGNGPKVQDRVSWIAIGRPLTDLECVVKPKIAKDLLNSGDAEMRAARLQAWPPDEGDTSGDGHSFWQYGRDIKPGWVFAS